MGQNEYLMRKAHWGWGLGTPTLLGLNDLQEGDLLLDKRTAEAKGGAESTVATTVARKVLSK